ncbi:hypothetical protein F4802DRAFT_370572 [Xylaria palmicola]|nr:hypothetical protein F4802DRAFT_370572 [Xylaria palmicola]
MASSLGIWYGAWSYIAFVVILAVLSAAAVALRLRSRRLAGSGAQVDDWLALSALLLSLGLGATTVVAFLVNGLGWDARSLAAVDLRAASELQKLNFIGIILYGTALTSIRLSVLLFYLRVFPTAIVRRGGYVLATASIAWFITTEVFNLARCKPITYMWNQSIADGRCVSAAAGIIVPAAFNVVVDACTVTLPVREVVKLKLWTEKRRKMIGVFVIGGIATVASLARLVSMSIYLTLDYETDHGTGELSALYSASSCFEVFLAIIAACAPTVLPAYHKVRDIFRPAPSDSPIPYRAGFTTKPPKAQAHAHHTRAGSNPALRESDDEERPFKRLDDVQVLVPAKERGELWTDISARPASEGVPLGAIRVQRDVTWNSED